MKGALLCSLLASTATAHMQMMKPYPIRSPLNKDSQGQKDYSYTNPLQTSGADYPCKGYANDKFESQASYSQGQTYTMELDGSATHSGGSCQLALTYDQGKSFKVIESMLGDCPIAKKYDFQIPSDAPNGEALLAWTWFNKVGNREMYMNCAMVTIGGASSGSQTDAETQGTRKIHSPAMIENKIVSHPPKIMDVHHGQMESQRGSGFSKAASFDSLPDLFVANVNQEGQCVTIEGEAVDFPKPGDNVLGKIDGTGKGYKCSGSAPFLGSASSDSASKDTTNSKQDKTNKATTLTATSTTKDTTLATRSTTKDTKLTTTSINKATTLATTSTTKDTTLATRSTPQSMSKVAEALGTSAAADPRVLPTDGASTNNAFSSYVGTYKCSSGEIICSPDGLSWAMCANGAPVFMGSVAAGMSCRLGAMVAAPW
ncbi:hypothetical protein N7520_007535 [Penicillium odoratum]|uniref:uncharacterized protein n=1 Tax=Penicillium odoratum TaxID=1167516 RepID=UPI0025476B54|nr:uncharacterized protein N7520_007535 [Penicillium odoratum]KAJ5760379.1 hypothetical protein N7520_007535 [Penicillium odoratum]